MTESAKPATVPEVAQLDVIEELLTTPGLLTTEGVAHIRSMLVNDPRFRSTQAMRTRVLAMSRLARERGWPATDDPAWPGDDDPAWDVPVPEIPDVPPAAPGTPDSPPRW